MNTIFTNKLPFFLTTFFLFFLLNISAQILSPNNIKNIKVNELSDGEIVQIKNEMDKQNISMSTLENLAIVNGMSASDFSVLKTRIENIDPKINQTNVETGTTIAEKPIEMDKNSSGDTKRFHSSIFGSEIFSNPSLSFEPNSSMATPANYILGFGDELQIVIYGMQEAAANVTVSKEGKISIPIVGQIFINGLTFEAANSQIKKACSKIYSSLNSGQSNLSVSLSKIRTIKITILGARKPGNYSVSSLSTVFNALHIAGGPDDNGSYRNIELIRNNKVIRKIDIYKFLTTGDQSDNINLLDDDVIRIPVYENRVKIEGKVKRPGIFELLPKENFTDLLKYCSGFDESAYKANIKLVQNTDKELKITDLSENEYQNYTPKLGDIFKVSTILNRFENKVSIKGSVFRPDDYALTDSMTIKKLIDKADGLTEDAFKNRALLIREKEDLTKEIQNIDLNTVLNGNNDIILRKNDELIISSIFDLKNQHTVFISGNVKKPGEFPFVENLTLYDLILQAGGFTEGASKLVEIARIIIKDERIKDQKENSIITTIEIDTALMDKSKNVKLSPFDVVQIRRKPVFETQKNIIIIGQVMFPGAYTIATKNERFLDFINRSGGLKSDANMDAIFIMRNGRKIPINYKLITKRPKLSRNIIMKPGDEVYINKLDNTVKVSGNVYLNSEVPFVKGKSLKYYISSVGGYNENSDKSRVYVIKPNGLGKATKSFLGIKNYPKIEPGCEIFVPVKIQKIKNENKLSTAEITLIGSAVSTFATALIAIIQLTK